MKIALIGDTMLGRLVNKHLLHADAKYPWGNTLPILKSADMRICNLECVISDVGAPWSATPKVFHFRTDEKNVSSLLAARIDIASIANNHVLDYEYDALLRMLDILDTNRILHAGSGKTVQAALKPAVCQAAGQTIGLIAFTDNEPDWEARKNVPGVYYVPIKVDDPKAENLFQQIGKLREEVDYVIVSAHWGPNWGYAPPKEQVPFAHAMVDAGADLIFGHSPHVFRAIEIYRGRPIIYSAGDFIDDYAVDEVERNDQSFIFMVEWSPGKDAKVVLYPTCIEEFQARLAEDEMRDAILVKMERLCKGFDTPVKRHAGTLVIGH